MAEREDANPLSDTYPQSYNVKLQRDPKPWIRMPKAIPRWIMLTKVLQKSDPELGAFDVPARPSARLPRYTKFFDSDETFMVHRRFGLLHCRVLSQAQEKIIRLEQCLEELDELDGKARKRDESTPHGSRDWLLKTMKEKLSDYGR